MDHQENELLELLSSNPNKNKSPHELETVVRYLFEAPDMTGKKISEIAKQPSGQRDHNIDIPMIFQLYKSIRSHNLTHEIPKALDRSFDRLKEPSKLKQFVKNRDNIRFLLMIMLWEEIFTVKDYYLILLDFLYLVANMGLYKRILSQWCDDIPSEYMVLMITQLHLTIENELQKLQPEDVQQNQFEKVTINIENMSLFLEMLNESNDRCPRIKSETFNIVNIGEYFRHIDIFKQYLKKSKSLNFVRFPFLLDLDFKYKLLQIESIYQQKMNIHKNMENGFHNLLTSGSIQMDATGNISLEGLIFLHFQINRHNILDDSLEKIGKIKHNLKSPLKIQFIGQEGSDEGGVKNQFFQLVVKQIFNPYLDMFLPKNNERVYWFNGFSFQPPIRFEFVGILFGLAIYNSVHLHVKFPRLLYKKLLMREEQYNPSTDEIIEDLKDIEPQIYKSLKKILDSNDPLEQLELFFTIELNKFGEIIVQELVEDGSCIPLSQDNKSQYIHLYADHLLNRHTQKQFIAFKRGFDRVVDTDLIKILRPEQLEIIICGNEVIDFKELEESTNYEGGYTKETPVVQNLWQILQGLSVDQKKAFLIFCTGTDRVPLEGLKSLKFVIQKHANTHNLPTAHTCFNVLLLPQYETKEKLKKNIQFILKNNQGFGLI